MINRGYQSFPFGIEEEYFLVSLRTRALVDEPPRQLLDECKAVLGDRVSAEYQRSQIELATSICLNLSDARAELAWSRSVIAFIASRYGLAPIAASTHPFTSWNSQRHTDEERYNEIAHDLQALGRRMVIGGMHVHVGIDDNEQRISVMNHMRTFLPLLLALSTSSPFWQGENTGLKSYRTAINDATPRKGIPERFESWCQYQRAVATLVDAGVIEDATKIWWDLRPSARFPTLELRITDICPLIDDALCIAAVFRCLCRYFQRRNVGRCSPSHPLLLLNENRWRAQRYGLERGFIDPRRAEVITSNVVLHDLLELIQEDAEHFGCKTEVEHARVIFAHGSSADRQLALYHQLVAGGLSPAEALSAVVDQLISETGMKNATTFVDTHPFEIAALTSCSSP